MIATVAIAALSVAACAKKTETFNNTTDNTTAIVGPPGPDGRLQQQ
jgi:hypothetical protein